MRLRVSEDGMTASAITDVGEWIPLGPWWLPDEFERAKAFRLSPQGKRPLGLPVWCATCGCEGAFESFAEKAVAEAELLMKVFAALGMAPSPSK